MRNRFDQQLELLNEQLIRMGELCEVAIGKATTALKEGSMEQAQKVIEADEEIDQAETDIERLCLKLLLQQQPVARDLRQISAALKMITDMERIGDQASDIAEIIITEEKSEAQDIPKIIKMSEAAGKMVRDSVNAYVEKDLELSRKVIKDDDIVDELFENYLSRPDVRQPILTQSCDGHQVQCRNRGWMTQWGSKALGDQGYSAIEILRSFYGNDMYINVAEAVSGIPASWPGYDLTIGVTGEKVQQIQEQLNAIAKAYPAIPSVIVDGIYGPATAASVKKFQNIFGLPASGVVDYPTWYKIQDIYVAVTRIAELQ